MLYTGLLGIQIEIVESNWLIYSTLYKIMFCECPRSFCLSACFVSVSFCFLLQKNQVIILAS